MHRAGPVSAWLLVLIVGGCAGGPVASWQKSLERYVVEEGNGDLDVLRNVDRDPSEGDFSVIGARWGGMYFFSPKRTDANGVLLGLRELDDRNWYVFLVGAVRYQGSFVDFPMQDPRITDLRIAAVTNGPDGFHWLVGEPDQDAIKQYGEPQIERWRRSHASRGNAMTGPTRFPTPEDLFTLDKTPDGLTVIDENSGARWSPDAVHRPLSSWSRPCSCPYESYDILGRTRLPPRDD